MTRILEFRKQKNLTQEELGEQLGVGRTTISMWETGDAAPRVDKLPKLARIFGCTIDDLFEQETKY